MPWDQRSIQKHNKSLHGKSASKAASQANAILAAGAPEGVALATAFKHVNKLRKRGNISPRASSKLEGKYGSKEPTAVDASGA